MNPLLLSLLASFSTIIGSIIILIKKQEKILYYAISFASGVMLSISLFDLIPEGFTKICNYLYIFPSVLIFLLVFNIGVLIAFLIDKLVITNNKIYRVGIINLIAIIIHNIPEGIVTYLSGSFDIKLGITLSLAIALHNIPEGIAITLPIYYATNSKLKAIFLSIIAGLSEFLGAIIAYLFLKNLISDIFIGIILVIIAGIMLQISIYELLPNALKYKDRRDVIKFFILGIITTIISLIII